MPDSSAQSARNYPTGLRARQEFSCSHCSGEGFRRSRLRPGDLFAILTLLYPVRCMRCSRRQLASFSLAGLSVPTSVKHHRIVSDAESWGQWTAGETGRSAQPDQPSPSAPAAAFTPDTGARPRRPAQSHDRISHDRSGDLW